MSLKLLNDRQRRILESLHYNGACSAGDFDRSIVETLCRYGLAIKHSNGRNASYTLTEKGKDAYRRGTQLGNWHFSKPPR